MGACIINKRGLKSVYTCEVMCHGHKKDTQATKCPLQDNLINYNIVQLHQLLFTSNFYVYNLDDCYSTTSILPFPNGIVALKNLPFTSRKKNFYHFRKQTTFILDIFFRKIIFLLNQTKTDTTQNKRISHSVLHQFEEETQTFRRDESAHFLCARGELDNLVYFGNQFFSWLKTIFQIIFFCF